MRYLFEEYALDTDRRELHRGAEVVSVTPQAFDLLDFLIRNRERVVSKDDVIEAIWNGRSVSDAALTTRLNVARSAIGDSGEQQRLIKTLPRKGFRFVGAVREDLGPASAATADAELELPKPTVALPDKPSIAVLPFQNLSADPEQEYFADGVVEDITMALSRFRWLLVIARNSSFTYKGRPVDIKQVGRELAVRYVLEGSVRKAGNRIRIAGQLIDAETGAHLWADRFDGGLEDIFDLQDQVTSTVVGAIAPMLQREEIRRARRKPTENLDAYDYYLRGLASVRRWTREANSEALQLFCKAIELDPGLACAYGMAGWCYIQRKARRWMIDRAQESAEATRLGWKAVHLGADDPAAMCMGAYVLAFIAHEFDDAIAFVDRGLAINPNLAHAWNLGAWVRAFRGEPDLALDYAARAMRLSPLDPSMYAMHGAMSYAHFLSGRYDLASSGAEKALRDNPDFLLAICVFAASNALTGRLELAQKSIARARECNPDLRISNLEDLAPFRRVEDGALFAKGLREAGLPD
ncbi:winged helix-turn-helix domain-containing tetratricopeptide repeat protein [Bradyrhizobium septentrionale]|uniref:Winged helix-turn-helix domain-containing protein n=1 Tax=Bradyrhizobium septentrionale TaxID=1404411 RepID=A0A973VZP9_9BRAD|nr:winged helix-turn-helix domain-containing protein [Bradyrhizobium septentrionale]UGY13697.1 winged helix-turn-helix domain-containing protein [Bradyrhizobium septentrionale]UGY22334.1 winged helix-turn-helix domain-containing protein [Bradyrhizobium septentrionale]